MAQDDLKGRALRYSGWELVGKIFKWFFFSLFVIVLIGALIWLVFFGKNFITGGAGSVLLSEGTKIVEETGVGIAAKKGVIETIRLALEPEQLVTRYQWDADVEKNEKNKDLGVRIKEFKSNQGVYYPYDNIRAIGKVTADSLLEETKVQFFCGLEDYKNKPNIFFERRGDTEEENTYIFYKFQPRSLAVTCEFPEGIAMKDSKQDVEGKIVKLAADFEFVTKSDLKIYLLDKNVLEDFLLRGINPFEAKEIKDPRLNKDKTTRAISTYGPMKLALGSDDSQPFANDGEYSLGVSLSPNSDWKGYLKELKQIYIHVPPYIEIIPERGNFEATDKTDENGFKIYQLKKEAIDIANRGCDFSDLFNKDCATRLLGNLNFDTRFKINVALDDKIYHNYIRGTADYVFRTESIDSIQLKKSPSEGLGGVV